MSPEDACATWKDAIQPLAAKGYTLGAPCSSGNPNGITWMKKFFECCADCTIDFMTVHWYDIDLDNFKSWVQQWHDDFGNRDVMVTEFAVQVRSLILRNQISAFIYFNLLELQRWRPEGFGLHYELPQGSRCLGQNTTLVEGSRSLRYESSFFERRHLLTNICRCHARHAGCQHCQPAHEQRWLFD